MHKFRTDNLQLAKINISHMCPMNKNENDNIQNIAVKILFR